MYVVVDVLASDNRGDTARLLAINAGSGVLVLSTLLGQTPLVLLGVIMVDVTVLDGDDVVVVSLRKNLLILDRLDRSVVVVLVDLLVHSSSHILMLLLGDSLVCDCWCNVLVDLNKS